MNKQELEMILNEIRTKGNASTQQENDASNIMEAIEFFSN